MTEKRLSSEEIFAQLKEKGLESAAVIYCRVVGKKPIADWVDVAETKPQLTLTRCADLALEHLEKDPHSPLVILGDLYVEGNEPAAGIIWDKRTRINGLATGIMANLIILLRCQNLRDLLFPHPERLMFAVLDEGHMTIRTDEAKQMLAFLQREYLSAQK